MKDIANRYKNSSIIPLVDDIYDLITWGDFARCYFPDRSVSWFYNKMRGVDGNGGIGAFTDEERRQLSEGLHRPKVTAVYVWYDNHHYLRHKRGEPDKELVIDSTWALILNRFRDTLIQILNIDQYNMDIKRLIIPATMRRTPITRLP